MLAAAVAGVGKGSLQRAAILERDTDHILVRLD